MSYSKFKILLLGSCLEGNDYIFVCNRQRAIWVLRNQQMGMGQKLFVELAGKQEEELNLLISLMEWQAHRYIFFNVLIII